MSATKLTPVKFTDDETLAFLIYAVEGEIDEIEPYNKTYQDAAQQIYQILHKEYTTRGLEVGNFLATEEVCPKCGK